MNIGVIVSTNDPETAWNAFRFANLCIGKEDFVKVFLIAKGVESDQISGAPFDVREQMKKFVAGNGSIFACGSCLEMRQKEGSEMCPLSGMKDLYEIVVWADKVISF